MKVKKIVVLSGAGISAESGLKTFRDADGLWEGHNVYEVASSEGWAANPGLVLDFYNARRKQLLAVEPNIAHKVIASLEDAHTVNIITQNVDDLHERAGSKNVLHLHGELLKSRSSSNPTLQFECKSDILLGDLAPDGSQLRPNIVWFGEAIYFYDVAMDLVRQADVILIIGTSMQVYPAAGLVGFASRNSKIFYIDPNPSVSFELGSLMAQLTIIQEKATLGITFFMQKLNY